MFIIFSMMVYHALLLGYIILKYSIVGIIQTAAVVLTNLLEINLGI